MRRAIFWAVIPFVLAGCAASSSPGQSYRPQGAMDQWTIAGVKKGREVIVRINGAEIMKNDFSIFGGQMEMGGNYQGKPVSGSCVEISSFWSRDKKTQCTIFVGGERAAVLQF